MRTMVDDLAVALYCITYERRGDVVPNPTNSLWYEEALARVAIRAMQRKTLSRERLTQNLIGCINIIAGGSYKESEDRDDIEAYVDVCFAFLARWCY